MLANNIASKFLVRCISNLRVSRSFYDSRNRYQTIFAPSTAIDSNKGSPLGIIRISGIKSKNVVTNLTNLRIAPDVSATIKGVNLIKPRQATLSKIYDPDTKELIDVGIVLWFPGPKSYTGEDVCELQVHGSRSVFNKILDTLGRMEDVRPAEPGEFSRRAVMNNRMSLIQAESVHELIASKTDQQRKLALQGLTGSTRQKYDSWIENLLTTLAHLEAIIDFGEDELLGETQVVNECTTKIRNLSKDILDFITISERCKDFIQSGARVAILGKPNSGKSTFMNLLCRQEKSIVSDLSGTTRDVVEHSFELGGHTLTLSDTAGLRDLESSPVDQNVIGTTTSVIQKHNSIELEGMKRAMSAAKKAHLILYLFDKSEVTNVDEILDEIDRLFQNLDMPDHSRALHVIINKIDLAGDSSTSIRESKLRTRLKDGLQYAVDEVQVSMISCKTEENLNQLIESITTSLNRLQSSLRGPVAGRANSDVESDYVNERHLSLLRSAQRHLDKASQMNMRTIDEMAQHVRESVDYLSRIVGSVTNEQVLDIIFKDFCIGK